MDIHITGKEQLTTQWLTALLKKNGFLHNNEVAEITLAAEKKRYVSKSCYFAAQYRKKEEQLPSSFFLKVYDPGLDNELTGKKEVGFYKRIPALMPGFAFITCYAAEYDPETNRALLLFDDVSQNILLPQDIKPPARPGKESLKLVIKQLADFHAFWWDHPDLTTLCPLPDEKAYCAYITLNKERLAFFKDILKHKLPAAHRDILDRVLDEWQVLYTRLQSRKNLTLCHGDTNIYNILWPRLPETQTCYLIDWNYWQTHPGALDIAYLMALTLDPALSAELEDELLHYYHESLCGHGITGYSFDDFSSDYRLSLSSVLFTPVALCSWHLPFFAWWGQYKNSFLAFERLHCEKLLIHNTDYEIKNHAKAGN